MDRLDVVIASVIFSFFAILFGACLYSESMERECAANGMSKGYSSSDIRAICDIK